MSNGETEHDDGPDTGISDGQLPDDLQPSEDNPLAEGLEPGESAGDLLDEGKGAEEDDQQDGSGQDGRESGGSEQDDTGESDA